jgi:hypothetical protein
MKCLKQSANVEVAYFAHNVTGKCQVSAASASIDGLASIEVLDKVFSHVGVEVLVKSSREKD